MVLRCASRTSKGDIKMFDIRMKTLKDSIRLNSDGLVLRQGTTYVFLTRQEYMWLPVYHQRGTDMTIISEGGKITLMPHVADAIVSLISNVDYRKS